VSESSHPLDHLFLRMVVVSLVWVGFGAVGFLVYVTYIHDVGATFWVMQVFLLPIAIPLVLLLDGVLLRLPILSHRFATISALDSAFAILLWLKPLHGVMLLLCLLAYFRIWPKFRQIIRKRKYQ